LTPRRYDWRPCKSDVYVCDEGEIELRNFSKLLKEAALPAELLALLKTLKGELYATKFDFINALKALIDEKLMVTTPSPLSLENK
jgi:hypothetical protein